MKLKILFVFLLLGCIYCDDIFYLFIGERKFSRELPVYVINLDRSPGRYKAINAQLDKYGVKHQRFSAVDGYKIKITNLSTGEAFSGNDLKLGNHKIQEGIVYEVSCPNLSIKYIPKKIANHRGNYLTAGEFGCYCSHMEIWNEIKNQHIPYALVFEDDAILKRNFGKKLDDVINQLPNSWDILFLFFTGVKGWNKISTNIIKLKADGAPMSTSSSYLISEEGAKKSLEELKYFSIPIDCEISDRINQSRIAAFASSPFFAETQLPIFGKYLMGSSIADMGRELKI